MFLSNTYLKQAALLLSVSTIAGLGPISSAEAQGAGPSFEAACDANPSLAYVTRGQRTGLTRNLFSLDAPQTGTTPTVTQVGTINSPVNAIALYDGFLYGVPRFDTQIVQVASDASIVSTTPVPGFPARPDLNLIAGTIDPATGIYYLSGRLDTLYQVDVDNIAAGVTRTPVTLNGSPLVLKTDDFAFSDGLLYGFDKDLDQGITIDVATGEATAFPITGVPNRAYGSVWLSPDGTLNLNRRNTTYEVDISGATWVRTRKLTSTQIDADAQDGTVCPTPPPVSFDCDPNDETAFVTGSQDVLGFRSLYRYTPDTQTGMATLDSLGQIEAPLNAFGLYQDTLYGMHRTSGLLYKVAADASIIDSVAVPGLPIDRNRSYIAGTIDNTTGNFYVFARFFQKAYVFNVNDIAAGATKIPFTQDIADVVIDQPVLLDFADMAYFDNFLYTYDPIRASGARINVDPSGDFGNVEFFSVQNTIPTQLYPGVWFSPRGTLFLYKSAAETYEVDINDVNFGGWSLIDEYGGVSALRAQRDAATCGVPESLQRTSALRSNAVTPETAEAATRSVNPAIPGEVTIGAIYPNPANGRATISFGLPEAGAATLSVYDIVGREVATLYDAETEAGWTDASFDAYGLAAGTYIVRLRTASGAATGKVTVID